MCGGCWSSVRQHGEPTCPVCGEPGTSADAPCLGCRTAPPPWRAVASCGPYEGALRELVILLKTGRRDELAWPLADVLVGGWRAAGWPAPDLVTAVPSPWIRRMRRGYNHAGLLAARFARRAGLPYRETLRRVRASHQVGRSRAERLRLSPAAFPPRATVAGRVLLVDDVLTTGATAAACSISLSRAGAEEVYVLTLARTPRSGRIP